MYCSKCGSSLLKDAKFCKSCGNKIDYKAYKPDETDKSDKSGDSDGKNEGKPSPKKNHALIAVLSLVVVALIVVMIFLVSNLIPKDNSNAIAYIKDNTLYFKRDMTSDDEPFEVCEIDYDNLTTYEHNDISFFSDDGKYLYFQNDIYDHEGDLSKIQVSKIRDGADRNEKHIEEIDSKVYMASVNYLGNDELYYKTTDDDIHYYNGIESSTLAEDVKGYYISPDKKNVIYLVEEGIDNHDLCYQGLDGTSEPVIVDTDLPTQYFSSVSDDYINYHKNGKNIYIEYEDINHVNMEPIYELAKDFDNNNSIYAYFDEDGHRAFINTFEMVETSLYDFFIDDDPLQPLRYRDLRDYLKTEVIIHGSGSIWFYDGENEPVIFVENASTPTASYDIKNIIVYYSKFATTDFQMDISDIRTPSKLREELEDLDYNHEINKMYYRTRVIEERVFHNEYPEKFSQVISNGNNAIAYQIDENILICSLNEDGEIYEIDQIDNALIERWDNDILYYYAKIDDSESIGDLYAYVDESRIIFEEIFLDTVLFYDNNHIAAFDQYGFVMKRGLDEDVDIDSSITDYPILYNTNFIWLSDERLVLFDGENEYRIDRRVQIFSSLNEVASSGYGREIINENLPLDSVIPDNIESLYEDARERAIIEAETTEEEITEPETTVTETAEPETKKVETSSAESETFNHVERAAETGILGTWAYIDEEESLIWDFRINLDGTAEIGYGWVNSEYAGTYYGTYKVLEIMGSECLVEFDVIGGSPEYGDIPAGEQKRMVETLILERLPSGISTKSTGSELSGIIQTDVLYAGSQ